ncbi:Hypothetical protein RM25_0342 [Propionibacterium freudenreichii subsp. freudenreichii]|nr:Hypothetical protein RM25_0342 [Propionibacterium freudenreichii subsp. freudenreichii]
MVRFVGVFEQGDAGASMKGPSRRRGNATKGESVTARE